MPIRFQPAVGQILICDFPKDLEKPEMVKRRPVVCISPKDRNRFGYTTVVPLSTTEPMVKDRTALRSIFVRRFLQRTKT